MVPSTFEVSKKRTLEATESRDKRRRYLPVRLSDYYVKRPNLRLTAGGSLTINFPEARLSFLISHSRLLARLVPLWFNFRLARHPATIPT